MWKKGTGYLCECSSSVASWCAGRSSLKTKHGLVFSSKRPLQVCWGCSSSSAIAHPTVMVSIMLSWGHYLPPKIYLFSDVNSPSIFTQKSDTSVWYHKGGHICSKELRSGHSLSLISLHQCPCRELPLTHWRTSWWDCTSRFLAHQPRSWVHLTLCFWFPGALAGGWEKWVERFHGGFKPPWVVSAFRWSDILALWPPLSLGFEPGPLAFHLILWPIINIFLKRSFFLLKFLSWFLLPAGYEIYYNSWSHRMSQL